MAWWVFCVPNADLQTFMLTSEKALRFIDLLWALGLCHKKRPTMLATTARKGSPSMDGFCLANSPWASAGLPCKSRHLHSPSTRSVTIRAANQLLDQCVSPEMHHCTPISSVCDVKALLDGKGGVESAHAERHTVEYGMWMSRECWEFIQVRDQFCALARFTGSHLSDGHAYQDRRPLAPIQPLIYAAGAYQ